MKAVSGTRMARLVEDKGWRLARINGSHHIYMKDGRMERLVIPIHGSQSLKIGLQRSLMKLAGIREEDL
jgi:predicted RNA binding protein YcfA (HicA-like mRNA interferase family)